MEILVPIWRMLSSLVQHTQKKLQLMLTWKVEHRKRSMFFKEMTIQRVISCVITFSFGTLTEFFLSGFTNSILTTYLTVRFDIWHEVLFCNAKKTHEHVFVIEKSHQL